MTGHFALARPWLFRTSILLLMIAVAAVCMSSHYMGVSVHFFNTTGQKDANSMARNALWAMIGMLAALMGCLCAAFGRGAWRVVLVVLGVVLFVFSTVSV